ncbi:MAG TPA: FixH family protein [Noviherbaspirillum sp.]
MSQVSPSVNGAAARTGKPAPWYRHRWPWLLMLGPGLVVLAGVHTMWLAFTYQDALVSGDYYKQGKAINQDLRRTDAAAALKLDAALRYEPATGTLAGHINSAGRPYAAPLVITLSHSTLPEKDVTLMVQPDQAGQFRIALPMLDMARWTVSIENAERDWRMAGRWMWPQETSVRIVPDQVLPD